MRERTRRSKSFISIVANVGSIDVDVDVDDVLIDISTADLVAELERRAAEGDVAAALNASSPGAESVASHLDALFDGLRRGIDISTPAREVVYRLRGRIA